MPAAENVTIKSLQFPALVVSINILLCCGVKVKPFMAAAPASLRLMLKFQFLSEFIVDEALVLLTKLAVGVC